MGSTFIERRKVSPSQKSLTSAKGLYRLLVALSLLVVLGCGSDGDAYLPGL